MNEYLSPFGPWLRSSLSVSGVVGLILQTGNPTVGMEGAYRVRHGDRYPANPPSVTSYGIRQEDSPSV